MITSNQETTIMLTTIKANLFTVHYSSKMLLTVIAVLVLSTSRLVVADDQCTQYQLRTSYYPSSSCEYIYNMNPESRDKSGYYWIFDNNGPSDVYCGMNYTGLSCGDIYNNNPETGDNNGYYPINNNTQWVFCNMIDIAAVVANNRITFSCAGVEREWRRIASINMSAGDDCPTGWVKSSFSGITFCRAPNDSAGCYSTFFSTNRMSYQHVCGRAKGYQKGTPDAFNQGSRSIDTYYVDGLSITHGNPRQHIWTYAAGLTDAGNYDCCNCPCAATPGQQLSHDSFVGSNYYCESGTVNTVNFDTYYFSDPLWDGKVCSTRNRCCTINTNQPWFYYQLSKMTQDDIEVRICRDDFFSRDGILVDILELYIQ